MQARVVCAQTAPHGKPWWTQTGAVRHDRPPSSLGHPDLGGDPCAWSAAAASGTKRQRAAPGPTKTLRVPAPRRGSRGLPPGHAVAHKHQPLARQAPLRLRVAEPLQAAAAHRQLVCGAVGLAPLHRPQRQRAAQGAVRRRWWRRRGGWEPRPCSALCGMRGRAAGAGAAAASPAQNATRVSTAPAGEARQRLHAVRGAKQHLLPCLPQKAQPFIEDVSARHQPCPRLGGLPGGCVCGPCMERACPASRVTG